MFNQLDHIAIVVKDTDQALELYRDKLNLPVLFSEVLDDQPVRLTHLDVGGCHLQLVEPLSESHPLHDHLAKHGDSLHHICFLVEDVLQTMKELPSRGLASLDPSPRSGPTGRAAAFLDPSSTGGILLEITSDPYA